MYNYNPYLRQYDITPEERKIKSERKNYGHIIIKLLTGGNQWRPKNRIKIEIFL